jgi:zinc protease
MKKTSLIIGIVCIAVVSVFAQPKLIEKISKKGNELVIPYEKYVLPNGLTIVIHEDHSDPIVHVDVTYHVGSAREEIGKSGFAHFFEHMMFQGSDNVADEEHFKIVTEAGGTLNGTTNRDRTNYFETLPSNKLETALWLEADRMGFLLDAVTQRKFEIQRETVKNERGQNYDNRPYGLASEYTSKALYPYGHPYSWLTIGYIEDLNRVNVEDLKNFFLRWYGPNNAVLTIGGDVNPQEVLKLAEKYFGSIPKGQPVSNMNLPAPVLDKNRYVYFEDNVRFPMLNVTFPGVKAFHKDEPALTCLSEILGMGKNSLLYRNFVKNQKAIQAYSYHYGSELSGELSFSIMSYPNFKLSEIEQSLREALKEFEQNGVSDEDLQRFKAKYESRKINSLESVSGKVSQLAYFQTFTGNPNQTQKDIERYLSITKKDVMEAYMNYVKDKPSVILSIVPKGKADMAASAEMYDADKSRYVPGKDEYKGLVYKKAKDNFDRSKKPASGKNPVVKVPEYWTEKSENNIRFIGTKNAEIPMVNVFIKIDGGHLLNANYQNKAGLANLTALMMNEATTKYSSEVFASELEKLGSSISVSADEEDISISVRSLTKNLDATIALLEERMFNNAFNEEDFKRIKKQQLEAIANQKNQPTVIANNIFAKIIYGDNHIKGIPTNGTQATVENINLDDIKKFYNDNFSSLVTSVVVVGDINKEDAIKKLTFMKRMPSKNVNALTGIGPTPKIDKTKIYLAHKEKAAQSEIRIGYLALPYDAYGEYYKATLMNYNLGGNFNSRININLREDKGYTYGARSGFSGTTNPGTFRASAGVKINATDSSIVEFMKEIKEFRENGIKADELAFLKSSIGQKDALNYETGFKKAGFLADILAYELPKDFVDKRNNIINTITKEEIDLLAKKHLPYEKMAIVVVGDVEVVKPGLLKLGYDVVEVDADGNEKPKAEPAPANIPTETPTKTEEPVKGKKDKKAKGKK